MEDWLIEQLGNHYPSAGAGVALAIVLMAAWQFYRRNQRDHYLLMLMVKWHRDQHEEFSKWLAEEEEDRKE